MRSEWKAVLAWVLLLLFCLYIVGLGVSGKLTYYIHPRYELFALITIGCCLVIGLVGLGLSLRKALHTKRTGRLQIGDVWPGWTGLLMIALLLAGLFLAPQTLSTYIADQRSLDFNAITAPADSNSSLLFTTDTSQLSIREWVTALANSPDTAMYTGKPVKALGFVYANEQDGGDDVFYVSRFAITCCAVDARPIGLPVLYSDWRGTYSPETWVEVTGEWVERDGKLVIQPTNITTTQEPEDPYAQ